MKRFVAPRNARVTPAETRGQGSWMLRRMPLDEDGLRCTFELSRVGDPGETTIGLLRIIRRGQKSGRTFLPESFDRLGPEFASLGAEPGFYEQLIAAAGADIASDVMSGLRDIVLDTEAKVLVDSDPAVGAALLRTSPAVAAREEAPKLLSNLGTRGSTARRSLTFRAVSGALLRLAFELDPLLPGRVCVLVGQNGCGKTWLLARLALCAFDPKASKDRIEADFSLTRVLAFSYSAFDEFDVPGDTLAERQTYVRQGPAIGYAYFGLRDLSRAKTSRNAPLKGARSIARDFGHALDLAVAEDDGLIGRLLARLFTETSFGSFDGQVSAQELGDAGWLRKRFRESSTGHKFVLLLMVQLAAHVRQGSLVLIDEPEAHLHPPLLATFLTLLREALLHRDGCAIIATHSPLVVQETPAQHVRIVERESGVTSIRSPELETFGEDIGEISREVFRLKAPVGDYPDVLASLADELPIEAIEALFPRGLSRQARAMVMARQARRRRAQ